MKIRQVVFLLCLSNVITIDIIQVRLSTDSPNSWIVHQDRQGFIIDAGCYWEHGILLAKKWREQVSSDTDPSFVFLTHTHPDNILGLASLFHGLNRTDLPVYVHHAGALDEMNYWLKIWADINPFEDSTLFDLRQSPSSFYYERIIKVLDRPLTMFTNENIEIISNFPSAESVYPSMIYLPSIRALFTGDVVAVRSHLLVSPVDGYPESDHHICNWIGILQSLTCSFPSSANIYPSHGDGPSPMSFSETIESNIQWLTYMRALTFNSCNATFVMKFLDEVFRNYSNFEQAKAHLINRIPKMAIANGCRCLSNSSLTCRALQPPHCQYLPKNRTESTKTSAIPIACLNKYLSSLSNKNSYVDLSILSMLIFTVICRPFFE